MTTPTHGSGPRRSCPWTGQYPAGRRWTPGWWMSGKGCASNGTRYPSGSRGWTCPRPEGVGSYRSCTDWDMNLSTCPRMSYRERMSVSSSTCHTRDGTSLERPGFLFLSSILLPRAMTLTPDRRRAGGTRRARTARSSSSSTRASGIPGPSSPTGLSSE